MTLQIAMIELSNIWCNIFFGDDNWVYITNRDDQVVAKAEMDDVNDDAEVAQFIMNYVNA